MNKKARVIAFYLPQYHPIPENDEWWGKGFTEWTNVGKAKPLFKGHYQPRVPADLGYYDLRLPIVREQQAEMAREVGIEGFCYWHYWFGNGKTLLSEIFDEVLSSGKPDFPFCLGWANHDWTRRTWNSAVALERRNTDLMLQTYPGDEDYIAHFYNVLPAFKDKRYITIEGRPVFLIYAPLDIPNFENFKTLWNDLAKANGLKNIFFILHIQGRRAIKGDVFKLDGDGFNIDHFTQAEAKVGGFNRYRIRERLKRIIPRYVPIKKYDYGDIISHWFTENENSENYFPMIFPNFDRSPRAGVRAQIYINSTPELFKIHVKESLKLVENRRNDYKMVFLKSWNEWGEGNYMEPDLTWGHGYLNALKEVIVEE